MVGGYAILKGRRRCSRSSVTAWKLRSMVRRHWWRSSRSLTMSLHSTNGSLLVGGGQGLVEP